MVSLVLCNIVQMVVIMFIVKFTSCRLIYPREKSLLFMLYSGILSSFITFLLCQMLPKFMYTDTLHFTFFSLSFVLSVLSFVLSSPYQFDAIHTQTHTQMRVHTLTRNICCTNRTSWIKWSNAKWQMFDWWIQMSLYLVEFEIFFFFSFFAKPHKPKNVFPNVISTLCTHITFIKCVLFGGWYMRIICVSFFFSWHTHTHTHNIQWNFGCCCCCRWSGYVYKEM